MICSCVVASQKLKIAGLLLLLVLFQVSVAQMSENAPVDDPMIFNSTKDGNDFNARIAPLIVRARNTWPDAKARFLKNRSILLFVSYKLVDQQKRAETVFVRVKSLAAGFITGAIASEIGIVSGYREGDELIIPENQIMDWTISLPDGREDGNLIGKYIDSTRAAKDRSH